LNYELRNFNSELSTQNSAAKLHGCKIIKHLQMQVFFGLRKKVLYSAANGRFPLFLSAFFALVSLKGLLFFFRKD